MDSSNISVTCRTCGRQANAGSFVLDPDFKKMVCPACVKDKRSRLEKDRRDKEKLKNHLESLADKPIGWDAEDEYLEKVAKPKPKESIELSFPSAGEGKAKYKCPKCSFPFVYDINRRKPSVCPYCSDPIRKFVIKN
ncbi:hypothetical protein C0585_03450 [Candidatus Woesearchaeota archaeon]|nr:MAG: hypothetical protein C0585_03450 [Candidatus Woesearchaeota archaeon]